VTCYVRNYYTSEFIISLYIASYHTVSDYLCIAIAVWIAHLILSRISLSSSRCRGLQEIVIMWCSALGSVTGLKWWFQTVWASSYTCTVQVVPRSLNTIWRSEVVSTQISNPIIRFQSLKCPVFVWHLRFLSSVQLLTTLFAASRQQYFSLTTNQPQHSEQSEQRDISKKKPKLCFPSVWSFFF